MEVLWAAIVLSVVGLVIFLVPRMSAWGWRPFTTQPTAKQIPRCPPPNRVFPSGGPDGKGGMMPPAPGPGWDIPAWDPETVQKVIAMREVKLDYEHFKHLMGRTSPNTPEPPPTGDGAPVWELVIADMKERDHVGRAKYGTPLRTHNGRRPLVDAYQEVLDLAVYLRQEIEEMKHDER